MSVAGHMISYDMAPGRFNLRAAGIAMRAGRVLIHRAITDPFWALPGGRVEWGETAAATLRREVWEELGVAGEIGPLRFVMERFFTFGGSRFHELAYYFTLELPDDFPFDGDGAVCHRSVDGTAELEFRWVPAEASALAAHAFVPSALRGRLGAAGGLEHIVEAE